MLLKQLYFMRKLYHNKVVTKNNSDGERKVWAGQVQGRHPVQDQSRGVPCGLTGAFARDIPVPRRVRQGADRGRRGLLWAGTWRGGGASVRVGLRGPKTLGTGVPRVWGERGARKDGGREHRRWGTEVIGPGRGGARV